MNKDNQLLIESYNRVRFVPPKTKTFIIKNKPMMGVEIKLAEDHIMPEGVYPGLRYGYCLEIDGKKFKTKDGIRCSRECCGGPKPFMIENGGAIWELYDERKTI